MARRRLHVLGGHVPFEDVLEVAREREVHVVEVRHVDYVVDDLAAVRTLDAQRIPGPVGPFRGPESLDLGNRHVGGRRVALWIVPDVELSVALDGRPGPGPRQRRDASRIRDSRALAVAAPAPVVERARDGVALHWAVRQAATHVTAVGVEHAEGPVRRLEHHQGRAERVDLVRGAVPEGFGQTQAVPPPRETRWCRSHFDHPDFVAVNGTVARHVYLRLAVRQEHPRGVVQLIVSASGPPRYPTLPLSERLSHPPFTSELSASRSQGPHPPFARCGDYRADHISADWEERWPH